MCIQGCIYDGFLLSLWGCRKFIRSIWIQKIAIKRKLNVYWVRRLQGVINGIENINNINIISMVKMLLKQILYVACCIDSWRSVIRRNVFCSDAAGKSPHWMNTEGNYAAPLQLISADFSYILWRWNHNRILFNFFLRI